LESIFKIIFFLLGGIIVLGLFILLLPVLLLLYIFTPKRSSQTWFNTFAQQAGKYGSRKKQAKPETPYYSNIPASEDIIDVSADEINDKK